MKKIFLFISVLTFSLSFSQNNINLTITGGNCSNYGGVYIFTGLVNGKNNYSKSFVVSGNNVTLSIAFDATKWVFHNGTINDFGFYNPNVPSDELPPSSGWISTNCNGGTLTINQILNINESETKRFKIYPNPSNDFIYIEDLFTNNEIYTYNVIDSTGRIVSIQNRNPENKIDISNLPNGYYLLTIKNSNEEQFYQKIIKN